MLVTAHSSSGHYAGVVIGNFDHKFRQFRRKI